MLSFRRWLDRMTDRRPVVRRSPASRRPWWRHGRPWLLLALMLALIAAITLLLGQVQAVQAMPTPAP